jgi:hypothetical protein
VSWPRAGWSPPPSPPAWASPEMTGTRHGGDRAGPGHAATDLDRPGRAQDVGFALLAAGVLIGLPVLVWMLGAY